MKTELIEFLKLNIGKDSSDHLHGFGAWLNPKLVSIEDSGDIELEFRIREDMLNPLGTIHGGALASILDEAMGMQLFIKSGEGDAFFAMNLLVDFVKSSKVNQSLFARPEIVRLGKKSANLRCTVYNSDRTIVAHGFSNFHKLNT